MTKEQKEWIDGASYASLLDKWRNDPIGSPWFKDNTGDYYQKVMVEKKIARGQAGAVADSKAIGWEGK